MKTILIYDQLEANLKFAVLEGDYSHLNMVYINQCFDESKAKRVAREKLQEELNALVYDDQTGEFRLIFTEEFPLDAAKEEGVKVIVAGFLP